jgi:serine/threonine-protein kinase
MERDPRPPSPLPPSLRGDTLSLDDEDGGVDLHEAETGVAPLVLPGETGPLVPAAPAPPERIGPGQRLGRFVVTGELGRGGMGLVVRARDPDSGREVAIKTLLHGKASPASQARFRREVDALAILSHPNIVKVHEAGEEGGRPYLVCELIEGARPLLAACRGRPLAEQVGLLRDACAALGHAHAQGVVHRDVKADNLLVDAAGRVRVTDFGLAMLEDEGRLTRTGELVGTPLAMSPEQITGQRGAIGPATDVWGLGVVLYELLTAGVRPFEADTLPALAQRICAAAPLAPRALSPDVPAALEAVCLRALRADPSARWPDGEAMAAALDAALAAPPPPPRRPLVLLASVGAVVVVAFGAWLALRGHAAPPIAPPRTAPPRVAPAPTPPRPVDADHLDDPALPRALREQARRGDAAAMAELGRTLRDGDPTAARRWLLRAADAGQPAAMVDLAELLRDGRGGGPDAPGAIAWFERAAALGEHEAASGLAGLYGAGAPGVALDLDRAIEWRRRAVELARSRGRSLVARDQQVELCVDLLRRRRMEDLNEATTLLHEAGAAGSPRALLLLADYDLSIGALGAARECLAVLRARHPTYSPDEVADLTRRCR